MRTFVVAVLLLASRLAFAERTAVLVLGEPTLQQPVGAMVQGWLEEHGHAAVPDALSADTRKTFANCFVIEDVACARGVFQQQVHAESLVYVRVDLAPDRHGRMLVLTGYWFVEEHDPVVDKRPCARCNDRMLGQTVRAMMVTLAKSSGLDKGRLVLDSKPSGLVVTLDGIKIGVTPLERDLGAGPHELQLVQDGKIVARKAVSVEAGNRLELVLPARPEPVAVKPPPVRVVEKVKVVTVTRTVHAAPSRVWPALLIGAGLAAGATGAVFLYYGQKGGPDEPYVYPDSTTPGLALSIGGGALVITGIIVALARGGSHDSGPTATLGAGGGSIGWAGSF